MTDFDADFILDDLEAHDEFVCSRCLKEKPRAGSVTMPGEDTHTSYRWCETCLADAYRQRYGDVALVPCGKRRDGDGPTLAETRAPAARSGAWLARSQDLWCRET